MTQRYQDWLAAQIINEGNIISYRSLSRALKVHSNAAKEMLYDFHRTQNARKPGSLHATYLLAGTRKPETQPSSNGHTSTSQPDEDVPMSDISFLNSSMPDQDGQAEGASIPVTTITLVKEEELEDVKNSYELLESMHVYSLEPSTLKNIQILSDCNRKITTEYASDDLLQTWKTYGTIYNPLAKRRTGARPPPPPADSKPAAAAAAPKATAPKPAPAEAPTPDPTTTTTKPALSRTSSVKSDSTTTTTKKPTTSKPPALKKESSSIFKAFATKPKSAPSATRTTSASEASAAVSPAAESPAADEPMPDAPSSSDDEAEADFAGNALDGDAAKTAAAANRAAKDEREANLRKMMDAEDEDDDDVPAAARPDGPIEDPTAIESEPESAPKTIVSNGRRRGRRRVMKKKTTKDAEGYLVTREEMGWESFSESDREAEVAAAKKMNVGTGTGAKSGTGTGTGGGGGGGAKGGGAGGAAKKKGQGNIMSFFGKK